MNELAKRMKDVWEHTVTRNAHLGVDGETEMLMARYQDLVVKHVETRDKVVVDFGMGGALLGVCLLENHRTAPSRYIGYDIAERSMLVARSNMSRFDPSRYELVLLEEHRWSFAEKHPDVIVCLACIIHFPTKSYLDSVLHEMNVAGAEDLVLEVRDTGIGTRFQQDPYSSVKKSILACVTDEPYVTEHLPNYTLVDATRPATKFKLQILWYKRRSA